MEYIYGKAPIKFTDGIPSHLAGEWPGIKSCRFHSYRRVIYPNDHGIIYNQDEPTLKPKKKLLAPIEPSPEFVYRACSKRVVLETDPNLLKPKGKKCLPFPSKNIIPLKERTHRFLYKIEQDKKNLEEIKTQPNDFFVKRELKYLARSRGFFPKQYYYVNDVKLMMTMNNDNKNNLNFDDEIHYNEEYEILTKKQKKELKLKKLREKKENLNKEIELVKSLTDWDKKFFPKQEKKEIVLPEIKTEENNNNENEEIDDNKSKKSNKSNKNKK